MKSGLLALLNGRFFLLRFSFGFVLLLFLFCENAISQNLLADANGNGILEVIAFGDSLTRGVGDGHEPGDDVGSGTLSTPDGEAGYPLRVEVLLHVSVQNYGKPGERLSTQGLERFAKSVLPARPDLVIISGGSNDALDQLPSDEFFRSVQTMINIARASGIEVVIATTPPMCCEHAGNKPWVDTYDRVFRNVSAVNDVAMADVARAYANTCTIASCDLLNRPEGLHPNSDGYQVFAEAVLARLLDIDLFAPDGPTLLEGALGLAPGSVLTNPDPTAAAIDDNSTSD